MSKISYYFLLNIIVVIALALFSFYVSYQGGKDAGIEGTRLDSIKGMDIKYYKSGDFLKMEARGVLLPGESYTLDEVIETLVLPSIKRAVDSNDIHRN